MIQPERIRPLNDKPARAGGRYVLYAMQQAQRAACNHALEYAVRAANERGLPVLAVFGLVPDFPEAGRRAYWFMLEGLHETRLALAARGIRLVVRPEAPDRAAAGLAADAALLVTDAGYLRIQRDWRRAMGEAAPGAAVQVETDVVVPVETVLDREAWSAAALRPRLTKRLVDFLVPLRETPPARSSLRLKIAGADLDLSDPAAALKRLGVTGGPDPVTAFRGGAAEAGLRLERFLHGRLKDYEVVRNDPSRAGTSELSPYLHFGQIAPLAVALAVREAWDRKPADAFLEQMIVRRELACNFTRFNPAYDRYAGLPDWARRTLAAQAGVKRPYVYDRPAFEGARTHDPAWNAAQRQMVATGHLHGYMRMYWGKKILEWSRTPEEAFETALALNNRYELDGRDPNGFAGVAWCFGKHDRPWPAHPVFGNVRMMAASGLARKFDVDAYVKQWSAT